jgi:phosphate starvation-inducible PhoH-like protein
MAKQTRGKSNSFGSKPGKRSRNAATETDNQVIDINRFQQRKHPTRLPTCHNPLIQARNQAQGHYLAAIKTHQLTFGLGPAGTGKTFCATAMAVEAFERREVERIIFTRPAIEAGEHLGFLPGKLQDKLEPWFGIFRCYLSDMLGRGVIDCALKNGRIVFEPLAFMRGKTFDNAFVLMDEAQNCTRLQLKMFLTRIGENSRVVINGDTRQSDLGNGSGLADAASRLAGLHGVYIHEFEAGDIVRSGLVRSITARYETG